MDNKWFKSNASLTDYHITIARLEPGIERILFIINILSRKVFVYVLNDDVSLLDLYKSFVSTHTITKLTTYIAMSKEFIEFNQTKNIKLITLDLGFNLPTELKIAPKEVGGQTHIIINVKNAVMSLIQQNIGHINCIDVSAEQYNSTPHSSLRRKKDGRVKVLSPNEAFDDKPFLNDLMVKTKLYNEELAKVRNAGFEPGVKVRVALFNSDGRFRNEIEMQNDKYYSKEVYVVVKRDGYGLQVKGPTGDMMTAMGRHMKLV